MTIITFTFSTCKFYPINDTGNVCFGKIYDDQKTNSQIKNQNTFKSFRNVEVSHAVGIYVLKFCFNVISCSMKIVKNGIDYRFVTLR